MRTHNLKNMKNSNPLDSLKKNHFRSIIINPLSIIFIIFFLLLYQSLNAQSEKKNEQQIHDLQTKLNELNASLVKMSKINQKDNGNLIKENTNTKEDNISNGKKENNNNLQQEEINTSEQKANQKNTESNKEKEEKPVIEDKKPDNEEYNKEKKKADWIIKTIDNSTHKERKNAINQILTIKDDSLKRELGEKIIDLIKNENELEVKIRAITVAGELKLQDATPHLINAFDDESQDVSVAAIYAIKRIEDHSAKPALIEKLKKQNLENNSTLIEALIDTLGEFKTIELIDFATQAIRDVKTNQIIRELLVLYFGKIESKDSKDILIELLKDEDENVQIRAYAANSLANLNIKEAGGDIEKVIQTIESYSFNKKRKFYNLYIYCIGALAKLGDEKAVPRLISSLRSDNAAVRLMAIKLIKEIKDKRTIDILKYKKDYDPNPKVQRAAREALIELGVESDKNSDKNDDSLKE